jgi:hypothetical protein
MAVIVPNVGPIDAREMSSKIIEIQNSLDTVDFASVTMTAAQINAAAATPTLATTTVAADVLAIPVTHQYVAKTTGADAEALTLANGVAGQILVIELSTDGGGDGTLTPTTKTGFAAIVFADAGDVVTLRYVNDTAGWIILGAFGATAQPAVTQ